MGSGFSGMLKNFTFGLFNNSSTAEKDDNEPGPATEPTSVNQFIAVGGLHNNE